MLNRITLYLVKRLELNKNKPMSGKKKEKKRRGMERSGTNKPVLMHLSLNMYDYHRKHFKRINPENFCTDPPCKDMGWPNWSRNHSCTDFDFGTREITFHSTWRKKSLDLHSRSSHLPPEPLFPGVSGSFFSGTLFVDR